MAKLILNTKLIVVVIAIMLLIFYLLWANYKYDCNIKYEIGNIYKIRIMSCSSRPAPRVGPHIGGAARYDQLIYIGDEKEYVVLDEVYVDAYTQQKIKKLSILSAAFSIIFPLPTIYRKSQLTRQVILHVEVGSGDGIVCSGDKCHYVKIGLPGDTSGNEYYLGRQKLANWITVGINKNREKIFVEQSTTYRSIIDKFNKINYTPYSPYTILQKYAYGEKVGFNDQYIELKPVVKRKLVSNDKGISWRQYSWEIIDSNRVPKSASLELYSIDRLH